MSVRTVNALDALQQRAAALRAQHLLAAAEQERKDAEAAYAATDAVRQELYRCNRHAINAAAQAVNAVKDASAVAHHTKEAVFNVGLAAVATQRGGPLQKHTSEAVKQAEVVLSQQANLLQSQAEYASAAPNLRVRTGSRPVVCAWQAD